MYSICPGNGSGEVKRTHQCELRPVCCKDDPGLPTHMRDEEPNSNVDPILIISEPTEKVCSHDECTENGGGGCNRVTYEFGTTLPNISLWSTFARTINRRTVA